MGEEKRERMRECRGGWEEGCAEKGYAATPAAAPALDGCEEAGPAKGWGRPAPRKACMKRCEGLLPLVAGEA